jgi:iron(III) transport system ATP-binding protein
MMQPAMTEQAPGIHLAAAGLSVSAVSLSYGAQKVLHDINLEVRPGEFFGLLGPSGCGKTTLLRLIAGFNEAQAGDVRIDGRSIARLPPWKRDVGMVFQSYALWPHMTVTRNVAFGLEERRLPKADVARKVAEALRLVGLSGLAERRPSQLSGGQQQRVALARTIAIEPKILLLDEPLSNLDAKLRIQVRRELRELQQRLGLTTIIVTHDQEEANTMCDRVAVMNEGVIQQLGPPTELYRRPRNLFVANFLGAANIFAGHVSHDGDRAAFVSGDLRFSLPAGSHVPAGVRLVVRPQDVRIGPAAENTNGAGLTVRGAVTFREFLGSHIRYNVLAGTASLLVDVPFHANDTPYAPGDQVRLSIPDDSICLIEA